jgi:hypothetical protein
MIYVPPYNIPIEILMDKLKLAVKETGIKSHGGYLLILELEKP